MLSTRPVRLRIETQFPSGWWQSWLPLIMFPRPATEEWLDSAQASASSHCNSSSINALLPALKARLSEDCCTAGLICLHVSSLAYIYAYMCVYITCVHHLLISLAYITCVYHLLMSLAYITCLYRLLISLAYIYRYYRERERSIDISICIYRYSCACGIDCKTCFTAKRT